jgi:two-component system CheB/CheR fusion protein
MRALELVSAALAQQQEHAIVVLDAEARIVEWLPAATRTFGWERAEMLGQTLERLFTPEDLARGDLDWELRAARSYGKGENDRWQLRKDGIRIWVTGILTALRDEAGALAGFVKILRDRTDIRTHIEALQSRCNQAEQLENERFAMLGVLGHELRNPLAPLRSASDLIRIAAPDDPRIRACAQIIDRQIRFMDEMLKDLLESTRVGIGKARLQYSTFELRSVIDAAVETCSTLLRDRGQQVELLLPDALALEADAIRLQQVLVNLLTNSSKFSPHGSRIWIKATVDARELVLAVEDHGRGIPPDMLPKVFELFTQAGASGERFGEGLGLGLRLVKSIVELHGGTVQARSEGTDRGTEISVRLPLRRADTQAPAADASASGSPLR